MPQNENTSISLTPHFADFISGQLREGRYSNASEVVGAGLRMLEQHEEKRSALHRAIQDGLRSGIAEDFDEEQFLAKVQNRHVGAT